jgi:hypothetical protein
LFSLGSMGGLLPRKLVKQTKVVSRTPNEIGFNQFRLAQTKADVRATGTGIQWEPDAAVRQKLSGFDPTNSVFNELAKTPRVVRW